LREKNKEMATYFTKTNGEVLVVPAKLTQEEDQRKIDDIWSRTSMNLRLSPQYNGKNFEYWYVRKKKKNCVL
jgi:hypothetical protein